MHSVNTPDRSFLIKNEGYGLGLPCVCADAMPINCRCGKQAISWLRLTCDAFFSEVVPVVGRYPPSQTARRNVTSSEPLSNSKHFVIVELGTEASAVVDRVGLEGENESIS